VISLFPAEEPSKLSDSEANRSDRHKIRRVFTQRYITSDVASA
jgi:hypothetical protein